MCRGNGILAIFFYFFKADDNSEAGNQEKSAQNSANIPILPTKVSPLIQPPILEETDALSDVNLNPVIEPPNDNEVTSSGPAIEALPLLTQTPMNNTISPHPRSNTKSSTLPKTIKSPDTGITYYLDELIFRYYYIDPTTNASVYYSP